MKPIKIIQKNKNLYKYKILKTLNAGLVLKGSEVKSIRNNDVVIDNAYVVINRNNIAQIIGMHIKNYQYQTFFKLDPERTRDVLLHKHEILKLNILLKKEAATIIPIKLFWENNLVKIEIGLAKGLKLYEKRQTEKNKEALKNLKNY
ncbi:SsrA-binding protein SmpB [Mycoplasma sp. SG1]|uniref:SsrA-binding protein SmpB n=1 Tax=Mycoplasma sp. SG1 TaxID=2810348 RepID=UPI00202501BC|nr:SsrA-binding protein SmpB [Mycoplasma sp. SG1]URM53006.1 SsrA-binding protein SmpB [Mycoplasma sp. SG1]